MIAPQDRKEEALRRLEVADAELAEMLDEAKTGRAAAMGEAYRAGATMTEIGERLGIGHSAVHHAMSRAGLDPKDLRSMRDAPASRSGLDPREVRAERSSGTEECCTWCYGSGEWVERKQLVPCKECAGTGSAMTLPGNER